MRQKLKIEVRQTACFAEWFSSLRDERAKARIRIRLDRVALGLLGDVKALKGGVSELRVDYGPGYRIYVAQRGAHVVLLLCGGDKGSQRADIVTAKRMAKEWTE